MLKKVIEDLTNNLFITLSNEEYKSFYNNKTKVLCNLIDDKKCQYPCKINEGGCKLSIKEKDLQNNDLKDKIINKFIEKMMIYKIDNIDEIIKEEIDINTLKKSAKRGEIFYR